MFDIVVESQSFGQGQLSVLTVLWKNLAAIVWEYVQCIQSKFFFDAPHIWKINSSVDMRAYY
ncbi:hypothetical protein HI914_07271 [Erysiphe necator]|nr:hypothetical protein HI914_07271 [Erysiphe necator]